MAQGFKQRVRSTTDGVIKDYLSRQKEITAYENDKQLNDFRNDIAFLGKV